MGIKISLKNPKNFFEQILDRLVSSLNLIKNFPEYLDKLKRELEQHQQQQQSSSSYELSADKKPMLLRALYSIGLMCRHFDFDALLSEPQRDQLAAACGVHAASNGCSSTAGAAEQPQQQQVNVVRTAVFSQLFHYSRSPDHAISQKALIALGGRIFLFFY